MKHQQTNLRVLGHRKFQWRTTAECAFNNRKNSFKSTIFVLMDVLCIINRHAA